MFIGIDLGTSSVKCVLVDENERVIATASEALVVSRPAPTHSEQNPASWWTATVTALDHLAHDAPAAMAAVRGIGLSGHLARCARPRAATLHSVERRARGDGMC